MVIVPILVFPNWNKEFHVHVDASCIDFVCGASTNLSKVENNYTTTEREGMAIVYSLQKFRNYFLGSHFKMFIYYYALKYLVNKYVLGVNICRWLLLF